MKVAFSLALACLTLFSSNAQSDSSKRVFESLKLKAPSAYIQSKEVDLVYLPYVKCEKARMFGSVKCESIDPFGNTINLDKRTSKQVVGIIGITEFGSALACYQSLDDSKYRCHEFDHDKSSRPYSRLDPKIQALSDVFGSQGIGLYSKRLELVSASGTFLLYSMSLGVQWRDSHTRSYLLYNSKLGTIRLLNIETKKEPVKLTENEIYFHQADSALRFDLGSEVISHTWDLNELSKSLYLSEGYHSGYRPIWCEVRNVNSPGLIIDCSLTDMRKQGKDGQGTIILNPDFEPLIFTASAIDKKDGLVPAHFRKNQNYVEGNYGLFQNVSGAIGWEELRSKLVDLRTGDVKKFPAYGLPISSGELVRNGELNLGTYTYNLETEKFTETGHLLKKCKLDPLTTISSTYIDGEGWVSVYNCFRNESSNWNGDFGFFNANTFTIPYAYSNLAQSENKKVFSLARYQKGSIRTFKLDVTNQEIVPTNHDITVGDKQAVYWLEGGENYLVAEVSDKYSCYFYYEKPLLLDSLRIVNSITGKTTKLEILNSSEPYVCKSVPGMQKLSIQTGESVYMLSSLLINLKTKKATMAHMNGPEMIFDAQFSWEHTK